MGVPAHSNSLLVRNVVSMLSHRVISRARLYEIVRWSGLLRPNDANQDPVMYRAEFGSVFLAEGPRTASIQEGLDCLDLYHSGLEGKLIGLRTRGARYRISLESDNSPLAEMIMHGKKPRSVEPRKNCSARYISQVIDQIHV